MAKAEFYIDDNKLQKGKVIGTEGVYGDAFTLVKEAVFDGNPLTCFRQQVPNKA